MQTTQAAETHPSIPIASAVIVQDQHTAGPFWVDWLSPDGALLRGPAAGDLSLGKATALLTLSGGGLIRLLVNVSQVEWWDGRCLNLSLTFAGLKTDLEDQLQAAVAEHLKRNHLPMTVILDGGRLDTPDVRRVFHALGREVAFVQNTLDALWFLGRFHDSCGTILIDLSFIRANGPEILPFLQDRYSAKRRVLVVPRSEAGEAEVGSLGWSVHGVLTTPWTIEQLESALGVFRARAVKHPRRILFVDDEPAILSGLQRRLRKYLGNYETVWATSGEVALAESTARPFDVVVADLGMPGMNGLDLLQAIKSHAPHAKRVVLSGCDTRAAKEVADIVLHKPCSLDLLRTEVLGPT